MVIGFNGENAEKKTHVYENYIGQPGHYAVGQINATGILKEINLVERYISVQPSIVGCGNDARLETEVPTIITIEQGSPISMRPLRKDDLEKIVKDYGQSMKNSDKTKTQ